MMLKSPSQLLKQVIFFNCQGYEQKPHEELNDEVMDKKTLSKFSQLS